MITEKSGELLKKKQTELDQLIVEKSPIDLKGVSYVNAKRLKLALLVEVGEFANEIKSFKAGRKKPEIDGVKAKEELIDCLGYFLGLVNFYRIAFPADSVSASKELEFNDLLLNFFNRTNVLFLMTDQRRYELGATKLVQKEELDTYFDGLSTFNQICAKLAINEQELMNIYCHKNIINQQRARLKE